MRMMASRPSFDGPCAAMPSVTISTHSKPFVPHRVFSCPWALQQPAVSAFHSVTRASRQRWRNLFIDDCRKHDLSGRTNRHSLPDKAPQTSSRCEPALHILRSATIDSPIFSTQSKGASMPTTRPCPYDCTARGDRPLFLGQQTDHIGAPGGDLRTSYVEPPVRNSKLSRQHILLYPLRLTEVKDSLEPRQSDHAEVGSLVGAR